MKPVVFVENKSQNCIAVCDTLKHPTPIKASVAEQFTDFFSNVFNANDWPARWHCGSWSDFHGWLYILSDLGIWAAYFVIPLLLLQLIGKLKNTPYYRVFLLFVAFIMLCALTHLVDAIIFWWPVYRLSAILRFATAVVSITTVYALYKNLPSILSLRTVKELEDEIEKRRIVEEKLAESEFLLSEAGRISRVGGWQVDLVKNNYVWSKNFLDILQLPLQPSLDSGLDHYLDEPSMQKLKEAYKKTKTQGRKFDMELLLTTYTGKSLWVRATGEPMYNQAGKVVQIRGILMDIDKYKTSEIALNRSLELITKSNDQLKNFTYILSHNIRNHASNLQLVSSLINTESLDQENAELFDMLKNISKGLDSTLEDLAQALKIREGTVTSEQLDFEVTATKATDILSLDLNINKAKIIFELAVKQINFPGIYLESIILNLISNAIKYRRPEVDPLITLRTYKNSSGNTVLECEDNGLGIDLNLHGHKIFGLYKTFHGNKGAHGIGLFLVKLQVESQGGMIEVESTLGKGTIFKITFNE